MACAWVGGASPAPRGVSVERLDDPIPPSQWAQLRRSLPQPAIEVRDVPECLPCHVHAPMRVTDGQRPLRGSSRRSAGAELTIGTRADISFAARDRPDEAK